MTIASRLSTSYPSSALRAPSPRKRGEGLSRHLSVESPSPRVRGEGGAQRRVRGALAFVAFLLASPLFAAGDPWDGAPLSAAPKALLAAAEAVPAGEAGVVVLLDEATHTFDERGGSVSTQRIVYRIANDSAIDQWGSANARWAPW